jgi:hypothetical protein
MGVLTVVIWLILDNLNTPVVWINQYTIFVALSFLVEIVFLVLYKVRKGNRKEQKDNEAGYGNATAG